MLTSEGLTLEYLEAQHKLLCEVYDVAIEMVEDMSEDLRHRAETQLHPKFKALLKEKGVKVSLFGVMDACALAKDLIAQAKGGTSMSRIPKGLLGDLKPYGLESLKGHTLTIEGKRAFIAHVSLRSVNRFLSGRVQREMSVLSTLTGCELYGYLHTPVEDIPRLIASMGPDARSSMGIEKAIYTHRLSSPVKVALK